MLNGVGQILSELFRVKSRELGFPAEMDFPAIFFWVGVSKSTTRKLPVYFKVKNGQLRILHLGIGPFFRNFFPLL